VNKAKAGREEANADLAERIAEVASQMIGEKEPKPRSEACLLIRGRRVRRVGGPEVWGDTRPFDVKAVIYTSEDERKPRGYDIELCSREQDQKKAEKALAKAAAILVADGIDPSSRCSLLWPQEADTYGNPTELEVADGSCRLVRRRQFKGVRPTLAEVSRLGM